MKFFDSVKTQATRGDSMHFKGHYKVMFSDALTGKPKEIIEQDNLITQAVADILAKNICGLGDMSALFPMRKMYSGILVFQNALTESASNFLPPNDLQNPMVAHAGDAMNDTASQLRGNPIFSDFVETDTSLKQVWSFDATHGNGTWGAIALCAGSGLGNMGLKPFNDEFSPLSVIGEKKTTIGTWGTFDEDTMKKYPWSIASDGQTCKSIWISGTTFKEHTMRHDFLKHGIMRGIDDWQLVSTRTATIRAFTADKSFAFEDSSYYYVATVTSATGISIDKIAKSDMTVTQQNCVFADVSLYTGDIYNGQSIRPFAFDAPYLYFPNSTRDHFYRLNISDNSDKDLMDGTISDIDVGRLSSSYSGEQFMNPLVVNSGLILGNKYLINGSTAYAIKKTEQIGMDYGSTRDTGFLDVVPVGAALWGNAFQSVEYQRIPFGQSLILNQLYLGSIANLPEPKAKSTSLTARVEYTLTEA